MSSLAIPLLASLFRLCWPGVLTPYRDIVVTRKTFNPKVCWLPVRIETAHPDLDKNFLSVGLFSVDFALGEAQQRRSGRSGRLPVACRFRELNYP